VGDRMKHDSKETKFKRNISSDGIMMTAFGKRVGMSEGSYDSDNEHCANKKNDEIILSIQLLEKQHLNRTIEIEDLRDLISEYWSFIPDEDKESVDKRLNKMKEYRE
jgi:hypothetical protein